jgi:TolB protein
MRNILLLILIVYVSNVYGQGKSYDYCYISNYSKTSKNRVICVYSIADKKEYPILNFKKFSDPCISPDGKKLAYTFYIGLYRHIGIIDLTTKRRTTLDTHCIYVDYPVWSPDGKLIAYNAWDDKQKKYSIAIISVSNKWHKILSNKFDDDPRCSWTNDGKNLLVNDFNSISVLNPSGDIIKTYKISDLVKIHGFSGVNEFVFTNDRKKIVFSSNVKEPGFEPENPKAIFIYDISTKTALRVSPTGYDCTDIIIRNNTVFFTGQKGYGPQSPDICTVDLDGRNFKALFHSAFNLSAKN